ncbi:hypothetical protein EVAR_5133_1 [Eumeta japonica]|uniref:BED-type domain-containing protein n=1 Tax=Eumeta variegata TaxID=151549 RepID=A0A4C1SUK9_EUMVA|nr:hypothetical protein EVAR_5133_1 [Eumeta japonica]
MFTNNPNEVYVEFSSPLTVWRYFKKAVNNPTARCKSCKAILETTSSFSKGLHVHMKPMHKIDTNTSNTAVRSTPITLELNSASLPSSSSSEFSTVLVTRSSIEKEAQSTSENREHFQTPQKRKKISCFFSIGLFVTKEKMISFMATKDGSLLVCSALRRR